MGHVWVWCTIGDGAEVCVCQRCGKQYTDKRAQEICGEKGNDKRDTNSSREGIRI